MPWPSFVLKRVIRSITPSPTGSPTAMANRSGLEPIRFQSAPNPVGAVRDALEEHRGRAEGLVSHVGDRSHLLVPVDFLADACQLPDSLDAGDPLTEVPGCLDAPVFHVSVLPR